MYVCIGFDIFVLTCCAMLLITIKIELLILCKIHTVDVYGT